MWYRAMTIKWTHVGGNNKILTINARFASFICVVSWTQETIFITILRQKYFSLLYLLQHICTLPKRTQDAEVVSKFWNRMSSFFKTFGVRKIQVDEIFLN